MEENGLNLYLQEMWYVKKRTEAIRTIALKEKTTLFPINYICLFNYLFISSQMSAKPYFIGSTGILLLW